MKKKDLKKLALMGITGGAMLASQGANSALPSEQSGLDPDQLLSARSWTCRKGNCAMDPNQGGSGQNAYSGKDDGNGKDNYAAITQVPPLTEEEFAQQLNIEGRRLFNSMNTEGKQLAMRLSKQYSDKNQAVKHAVRQMAMQDTGNSEKRNQLS